MNLPAPHTSGPPDADGSRRPAGVLRRGVSRVLGAARRRLAWAWARRPPGPRAAAIAFGVIAAGLGVYGIAFQATLTARLPSALDWSAAAALLERDARGGDAVVVAPRWAERAREVLPARVSVLSPARLAGEDLVGVRRVWLLAIPAAPGFTWDAEEELLERASRSDGPQPLGAVEVTRFDLATPELPLAFLPDRLATARVTSAGAECSPDVAGVRRCGPTHLARAVREVEGAPRPCLELEPGPAPLEVVFEGVPVGRILRGHLGRPGPDPARRGAIRIAVGVDGEELGAVDVAPFDLGPAAHALRSGGTEPGRPATSPRGTAAQDVSLGGAAQAAFAAFQLDTTRGAGRSRALSLTVTAPPGTGPICLDAVTLP